MRTNNFWKKRRKTKFIGRRMLHLPPRAFPPSNEHYYIASIEWRTVWCAAAAHQQQQQFSLFDHCCFRLFRMHPVASCCCCYGFGLTNSFRAGPSLYCCYTLHNENCMGIRFLETVIYLVFVRTSCSVSMA